MHRTPSPIGFSGKGSNITTLQGTPNGPIIDMTGYGPQNQYKLVNKSGSNSVKGQIYIGFSAGTSYAVGVATPLGQTYLAASIGLSVFWICTGGGIADGSIDTYVPLCDAQLVQVYCRTAATRGNVACLPEAGTGVAGQATDNGAAVVAGRTLGVFEETTGAPGLVWIMVAHTYA